MRYILLEFRFHRLHQNYNCEAPTFKPFVFPPEAYICRRRQENTSSKRFIHGNFEGVSNSRIFFKFYLFLNSPWKFNFYHLNRAWVACGRFHVKIMMNQYITVQGKMDYFSPVPSRSLLVRCWREV